MSKDVFIFEATEANFDQVVIQNSNKIPVITLFMGVWSEPCFVISEIFSKLAKEFPEQFIFAKVDVDEQQTLREQFKVENVPTILVIQNGEVSLTSEGLLTEDEARVLLKGVNVFNVIDEIREQARTKHMSGETEEAVILLGKAIQQDPANVNVALDMVQIFIDVKQIEQANDLFDKIPDSAKQSEMGKSITGQLTFVNLAEAKPDINSLQQALSNDENDKQARFDLAICLTAEYEYEKAIDHLLMLHQQDESFQDGAAKELIMTLIGMLKDSRPEISSRAQQRLSNLLIK
ncbi:MAG: co-chaperone YbbN [endosymbiont of Galathealinum brachiosum]|uniref:Co-chaperone YbbN n=1 Tax=endosymbiont of Galathealinum brachiosum TaxID=2200906 RepID=A0A370DIT1_9GAMM|nr:MAG: co-chaperone YbbN [endosymbiont of Galathealinum brachiosum]